MTGAILSRTGALDSSRQGYVHATCVLLGTSGVLILGASGSGKSALARVLIARARETGCPARLVGDDRVQLEICHGRLIARGHPAIRGQLEVRGGGILHVPYAEAAVTLLVLDFAPDSERFLDETGNFILIGGVKLRRCALRQDAASSDLAFSAWTALKGNLVI